MAKYEYAGPGPAEDPEGVIVRPGDVREFADEPAWGPWRALELPALPSPASPPAASVTPSVIAPAAAPPADPKGM